MTAITEWPAKLTAGWLREQYLSGTLDPEEVIREIIRRAARDKDMNIWIEAPAVAQIAPYLAALKELNPQEHPLWGIPFAVKDNIDVKGLPTTAACPEFAYQPEADAAVVARLVAAGAIPVGKSNLDQFATGLVGVRSPYGETHNALRPEYISGGSSAGSAVAVARGQAVFSLGTDTAGSGRVPAALNGLVGYKPSLGAWPVRGVVPACASLDCVTVFAHNLEDALTVDRAARGFDAADPWSRSVKREAAALPGKLLLPEAPLDFYGPHADEYRRTWERAEAAVQALGLPVERVDCTLFSEAAAILYDGPWVAERWADLAGFVESHREAVLPVTESILSSGAAERHTASSLFQAMHRLQQYKREAELLLRDAVLVLPTCGGTWTREQLAANPVGANSDMGRYTNHCNLLDLSAVAIPAGEAAGNLPFGITLFALADSEHLLAGAGARFLAEGDDGESGGSSAGAEAQLLAEHQSLEPEAGGCTSGAGGTAGADVGEAGGIGAATGAAIAAESPASGMVTLAVCGLHMRGFPLEKQMLEHGAHFWQEARTAACYELVKLPTVPAKPGLLRQAAGGSAIELELWQMPVESLGAFATLIPAPLGLGRVALADGREVTGFICEGYAAAGAENVTAYGGWRYLPAE
ncbi:allophanate hydrolase [Paenibacillus sp. FSL R7-277]|uniref:allophanate hydrolase n=1 Tax=Paenibacillus sp. FSL R7-277 TaxID=1227352 RepID=UPI0003E1F4C4|nr:allophanate hydrolase [Paenibacillus sp. FSL R7-277]ETT64366.1 allophanate hydrolase [Paenibacillus sp. FSL R7-277]